jgi:hypothetical protein
MFGAQYRLKAKQVKHDDMSWFIFDVQKAGFTPKELFEQCEGLYDQFKDYASDIVVHDLDDGQETVTETTSTGPAEPATGDQPPF